MLIDILRPFCIDTGYDLVSQRVAALSYINRAADEVYKNLEADAGLSEVTLVVPRDMQLTLPYYVGELRGLREYQYGPTIDLNGMGSTRYMSDTWKYKWKNWRIKAPSPVHTITDNTGVLTLSIPAISDYVVEVAMQTPTAARIVESVTMNAVTKQTTNSPTKVLSISSATSGRLYDITILDINGTEIAKLHNVQQKTLYKVIDVSEYQWVNSFSGNGLDSVTELLYKPAFVPFYNDTDEFMALGYDAAIQYKAMEMWFYGQENKEMSVLAFSKKTTQQMDVQTKNQESGEQAQLNFQPNSTYRAFRGIRRTNTLQGSYIPNNQSSS